MVECLPSMPKVLVPHLAWGKKKVKKMERKEVQIPTPRKCFMLGLQMQPSHELLFLDNVTWNLVGHDHNLKDESVAPAGLDVRLNIKPYWALRRERKAFNHLLGK